MKLKKMTAFLTAAVTACAAVPVLSVSAVTPLPTAPEWVPSTAEEAVNFINTYGETHIEENTICIVKAIGQDMVVNTSFGGTMKNFEVLQSEYLKYKPVTEEPVLPEEQTKEAMEKYHEQQRAYEQYQRIVEYHGKEVFEQADMYYVTVIAPSADGDLEFTLHPKHKAEEGVSKQDPMPSVYTFAYDTENQIVSETDIRSWLPDSYAEYAQYVKDNGTFSVHHDETGDKIVLCTSVNYSTGANLFIDQTGAPCNLVKYNTRGIKEQELLPIPRAGDTSRILQVYEPSAEGRIEFSVCEGFTFGEGPMNETKQAYTVKTDGELFALKAAESAAHDLNGDGLLSIADAVLLVKHLTGESKMTDTQCIGADLDGDKRVTAKDLTLLMKMLVEQNSKEVPRPLIDDPVKPYDPTEPIVIDDPIEKPVEK